MPRVSRQQTDRLCDGLAPCVLAQCVLTPSNHGAGVEGEAATREALLAHGAEGGAYDGRSATLYPATCSTGWLVSETNFVPALQTSSTTP